MTGGNPAIARGAADLALSLSRNFSICATRSVRDYPRHPAPAISTRTLRAASGADMIRPLARDAPVGA